MAVVNTLTFKDWSGTARTVSFLDGQEISKHSPSGLRTTVITGRNGSSKSTLLRELVAGLTLGNKSQAVDVLGEIGAPARVICMSGSVADRFPPKELPGSGRSEFDVPQYVYLGQRVGANLLSKKRSMETLLTLLLDEEKTHRTAWPFFDQAHALIGVKPHVEYEIQVAHTIRRNSLVKADILAHLLALSNGEEFRRPRPLPDVSKATAGWLVETFDYADFGELQAALTSKSRKFRVRVGANGATCEKLSIAAVRLGLLTDLLSLNEVYVRSRTTGSEFSANDLSSGEYHLYTSILGLGFGVDKSSVVLIDEPENSLHPQWQKDFMSILLQICEMAASNGHLIVCTHSPLIVGSAPIGSSLVKLGEDDSVAEIAPYGASSDEVLLSQFGVASSRNRFVVDTVQRAVALVEHGNFRNPEFLEMEGDLRKIRQALNNNDPLVTVIDALLDEEDLR